MWMAFIIGGVGLLGMIGLLMFCACAAAGRCDDAQDALDAERRREEAKHEADALWWALMDDAALDAAREGEC
jgi:hypothetical protein